MQPTEAERELEALRTARDALSNQIRAAEAKVDIERASPQRTLAARGVAGGQFYHPPGEATDTDAARERSWDASPRRTFTKVQSPQRFSGKVMLHDKLSPPRDRAAASPAAATTSPAKNPHWFEKDPADYSQSRAGLWSKKPGVDSPPAQQQQQQPAQQPDAARTARFEERWVPPPFDDESLATS